jgi:ribosome maturation protein Sdo1
VFTSDVRFLSPDDEDIERELERADFGNVYYRQAEDPSVGDVLTALRKVADTYTDHREIEIYVPGEWICSE